MSSRLFPPKTGKPTPSRYMIRITLEQIPGVSGHIKDFFELDDVDRFVDRLHEMNMTADISVTDIHISVCNVEINIIFDVLYHEDLDLYPLLKSAVKDSIGGRWPDWYRDYHPIQLFTINVNKKITWDME